MFSENSSKLSLSLNITRTNDQKWVIFVARNDIFSLKWRYYGPKNDIWEYWGTILLCLLFYYIRSLDKVLKG